MPCIFKAIDLQKRRIKIPERISLPIPLLVKHIVRSNNLLFTRSIKKTRIIKEVFDAMVDKDKFEAKTSL